MKKYSSTIQEGAILTVPEHKLNYGSYEVGDDELLSLWQSVVGNDVSLSVPQEFTNDHRYAYYQVEIPIGQWTRDGIINAIIRDKYRIDEMEAITNNMAAINAAFMQTLVTEGIVAATKYLKESINDDNTKRFKEMQEWRAMAKKVASEIIKD